MMELKEIVLLFWRSSHRLPTKGLRKYFSTIRRIRSAVARIGKRCSVVKPGSDFCVGSTTEQFVVSAERQ
jgi:hypothetical protein